MRRRVKGSDGKTEQQKEYFYGYKGHVSLNAETGFITSALATPGNAHDGRQFPRVFDRDLALGLAMEKVAADRAYDDTRPNLTRINPQHRSNCPPMKP